MSPPTSYELDSTHVTLREYSWGTPWILMPLVVILRLLRVRIPGSSDDPPVASVAPFEVAGEDLPPEIITRFELLVSQLAGLGFDRPVFHAIQDERQATVVYWATFVHATGQTVARIHYRRWTGVKPPREYLFPQFMTAFQDGTFLVTTSGKPDLLEPPAVRTRRLPGASPVELWDAHRRELTQLSHVQPIIPASTTIELRRILEQYHATVRDFHVQRGVFRPVPSADETFVATSTGVEVQASGWPDADVLVEIDRLQRRRAGWFSMLLILIVSLGLFAGVGLKEHGWTGLLLIVGVLFFHELGHYVAMKAFGYRNMRMFFIPFLGAAVSGRHYNVAGWKKAIVSLMGPLPGIALGTVLGTAGIVLNQPALTMSAVVLTLLNGFNLLPILPLDGGWVLHATLFCRHPVLDVSFKLLAGLCLVGLGLFSPTRVPLFLGVPLLISLPAAYRMARTAARLRRSGWQPLSVDAQTIPVESAQAIIREVRAEFPTGLNARSLAQATTQIFETLNAKPPHWFATLTLLGVQGGAFLLALAAGSVFYVAQHGSWRDFQQATAHPPKYRYRAGEQAVWRGPQAAEPSSEARTTIIATYAGSAEAETAQTALSQRLPPRATATRLGRSVLVSLPQDAPDAITEWTRELQSQSTDVVLSSPQAPAGLYVSGVAPDVGTAETIEREVQEYLAADPELLLVPPWYPAQAVPPAAGPIPHRARRTFLRLAEGEFDLYEDPRYQASVQRSVEAWSKKDQAATRQIADEQARLRQERRRERAEKMRKEGPEEVDFVVIERYDPWMEKRRQGDSVLGLVEALDEASTADAVPAKPAPERPAPELTDEALALGARLGQLPLQGKTPLPGATRFSASSGSVSHFGMLVRFEHLTFDRMDDGATALIQWLEQHQCVDLQYDFVGEE